MTELDSLFLLRPRPSCWVFSQAPVRLNPRLVVKFRITITVLHMMRGGPAARAFGGCIPSSKLFLAGVYFYPRKKKRVAILFCGLGIKANENAEEDSNTGDHQH